MRKILLSLVAVLAFGAANAQTEQGSIMLTGEVSFMTSKSNADNAVATSSFGIMPKAGYFISDNVAVGIMVGFESSKAPADMKMTQITVGPFGRYYVDLSDNFKFFGELGVGIGLASMDATDADGDVIDDTNAKRTVISASLSPNFAFFPADNIAIEFGLQGLYFESLGNVKDNDGEEVEGTGGSTIGFGPNFFSPTIGVSFFF